MLIDPWSLPLFSQAGAQVSATDAWAEPLSVIQNSALKMIEKSTFSKCAQALAWYFHDGRAMTVKGGSIAAVRGSAEVPHRRGCAAIALPAVRPPL